MGIDWFSVALISAISQGFLLCVVILSLNSGNRVANLLLAISVAFNTIPIAIYSFIRAEIPIPTLVYGSLLLTILKGPALYLYVRSLTEVDFRLNRKLLLHLTPIIPSCVIFLYLLSGIDIREPMSIYQFFGQTRLPLFNFYVNAVIMAYSIASLKKLEIHSRLMESAFSTTEPLSLNWLKGLIIFMIVICSFHFGLDVTHLLGYTSVEPKSIVVLLLNLGFIYFISFGGMRQPVIFTEKLQGVLEVTGRTEEEKTKAIEEPEQTEKKYQKSGLEPERLDDLWHRLTQLLTHEKPYLDDELTLPQLAEQLDAKPHDLSQVINSQSGSNFYELINKHRVQEAQLLLSNPEHARRKMLDIATEVGFKSQSTFYTQFKKHSDMTPRQFKEKHLKQVPVEASSPAT